MQKMFKIISRVIKTFYTLSIKNEISIKGKIKILVSVQKYWDLVFSIPKAGKKLLNISKSNYYVLVLSYLVIDIITNCKYSLMAEI